MRCRNRPKPLLGKGALFTFAARQAAWAKVRAQGGLSEGSTPFPAASLHLSVRFQPAEPEWVAGQEETLPFMGSAQASGQQGSPGQPLRPASVVAVARWQGRWEGIWMPLSVKAKEIPPHPRPPPPPEFLVKGTFQAWGIRILSVAPV